MAEPQRQEEKPKGLECPSCGCQDLRVYYTRPAVGGKVIRVRICRNCEWKITTNEKVSGT